MEQPPRPSSPMDETLSILREIDCALSHHLHWLNGLNRTLICNEMPLASDLADDAHCRCNFGLWFYRLSPTLLAEESLIASLEEPHRKMHVSARELLIRHAAGSSLSSDAYEAFMSLAMDFKQRLRTYQFQLVQRICSVDHLTGVWNRNYMAMQLAAEAERARRTRNTCAICILDLDYFKRINDTYGHLAGDQVLHDIAGFLKDNLRAYDSMYRYGGEEFLVCLPNTQLATAEPLINRLRERLATHAIDLDKHGRITVTASFGVAVLAPDEDVNLAIERADHALLCAKSKGRNRVCAWSVPA